MQTSWFQANFTSYLCEIHNRKSRRLPMRSQGKGKRGGVYMFWLLYCLYSQAMSYSQGLVQTMKYSRGIPFVPSSGSLPWVIAIFYLLITQGNNYSGPALLLSSNEIATYYRETFTYLDNFDCFSQSHRLVVVLPLRLANLNFPRLMPAPHRDTPVTCQVP